MDLRFLDSFDTNLSFWSGVLFSFSVLVITRYFDNRDRITTEQLTAIQLAAEANANKTKSVMLRYISHEIRTPLTVASSTLHFLREDGAGYNMSKDLFYERLSENRWKTNNRTLCHV